jgi:phage head maturation protease
MTAPIKMTVIERLDESAWDANKAMGACNDAACYRAICAGERTTGEPDQRQHWALPHHYPGKPANAKGVQAARGRLNQTGNLKSREAARRHLYETHKLPSDSEASLPPPIDNLFRAIRPDLHPVEVRSEDGSPPVLFGHFARFNEWTEIHSIFEGDFLERILPGAFEETFEENRDTIRPTFQHGRDPELGDKVLGPIQELREDDVGPYYEVPLFEGIPPLVMSGLRAGAYGASYRFRITAEDFDKKPEKSEHNPDKLPERTIRKVEVMEFGPVTWPADKGATAGVRSLTDWFIAEQYTHGEGLRVLAELAKARSKTETEETPEPAHESAPEPVSVPSVPILGARRRKPKWEL